MMENQNQVRLLEKLEENYAAFVAEWQALAPSELIEKAEEIYATRLVKDNLMSHMSEQRAAWFLRFENPLEIVRDKWTEENGMGTMHDEDLSHAVRTVMDCQDTESLYALAPGAEPSPGRDGPVTLREFIERHPGVAFDLMTPNGFVYLTPAKAQLLLSGQSVEGHLGDRKSSMGITAEELLNQEVVQVSFSGGMWHLLSDNIRETEQGLFPCEQGVTMC